MYIMVNSGWRPGRPPAAILRRRFAGPAFNNEPAHSTASARRLRRAGPFDDVWPDAAGPGTGLVLQPAIPPAVGSRRRPLRRDSTRDGRQRRLAGAASERHPVPGEAAAAVLGHGDPVPVARRQTVGFAALQRRPGIPAGP